MKRIFKKYCTLSLLLLAVSLFGVACKNGGKDSSTSSTPPDSSYEEVEDVVITLSDTELELAFGETAVLTADINSTQEVIEWEITEGTSVIAFDAVTGVITPIGLGEATIVARSNYSIATCKVTVIQVMDSCYTLALNRTFTRIALGQQMNLEATVRFGSTVLSDATTAWSVVEGDAVTVSNDGVVTAAHEGSSVVKAVFAPESGDPLTAECTIEVVPELEFYKIYPNGTEETDKLVLINESFRLAPAIFDEDGAPVDVAMDDLKFTSETPDILECLGNGRFRAINPGLGEVRVEYNGMDGYCFVDVFDFRANEMLENVGLQTGGYWGGSVKKLADGRLQYTAPNYASAVSLTAKGWDTIKNLAENYGYTKLVITLYSVKGDLMNLLVEGKSNLSANVRSKFAGLRETDKPAKYSIDYETFKDWTELQVMASLFSETEVTFSMSLEKHDVTAETRLLKKLGTTFNFDDLNVVVTGAEGVVNGLTSDDFIVTVQNPEIVTYEDGVFTAQAAGTAIVVVEYNGASFYAAIDVLGDSYTLPIDMFSVSNAYSNGEIQKVNANTARMYQHNWLGEFSVEIAGENWTNLKDLANEFGYTKIVLTVHSINGVPTFNSSAKNCLKFTGGNIIGKHMNNLSDFEDADSLMIAMMNTYWEIAGTHTMTFSISLESFDISAETKLMKKAGETFDFDELNVVVTSVTGVVNGLTSNDFVVTSEDPEIVTYENGIFTAHNGGTATIVVEYNGAVAYITLEVLGASYTVPFEMFTVDSAYPNGALLTTSLATVKMYQHNWLGEFALEIKGENWTNLKALAAELGYTKIVLTVYRVDGNPSFDSTDANCLKITGENIVGRHVNELSNFINADSLMVMKMTTPHSVSGTHVVYFSISFESFDISAETRLMTRAGSTLGFEDLKVVVSNATGVVNGLTSKDFKVSSQNPEIVTYENGVFTAHEAGTATIIAEYNGIQVFVTIDVLGDSYTIPTELFTVSSTYSNGELLPTSLAALKMYQHNWIGEFALEINGENWTNLKALATKLGYTKIVLTVVRVDGNPSFNSNGENSLKFTGGDIVGRHENDLSNYENADSLTVMRMNTSHAVSGTHVVYFSITLE